MTVSGARARIWDDIIPEIDRQVYARAGYGRQGGFGQRPVVLVVDVTYDYTGDRAEPILQSIERFPNSCGEVGWTALPYIQMLVTSARAHGLQVIYTRATPRPHAFQTAGWAWKNGSMRSPTADSRQIGNQIPSLIAPTDADLVIEKEKPSAFFGTPLLSYLLALRADSVIVAGATTSGCVRATVEDAFSYNLAVTVVEECTFDRGTVSHKVNLFDLDAKYADVRPLTEVLTFFERLPAG
jgi:maleamate amidohydrolase